MRDGGVLNTTYEPDGTVGLVATVGERRFVLLYNASGTCHLDGRAHTGKVVLVQ